MLLKMFKIFIADDEQSVIDGLSNMLDWNKAGFEIVGTASNGKDAFDLICKTNPDLVITDIRMPKGDGIWLAAHIQNILPHIHVIFLTGADNFEYAQKAINLNVKEYILKPIGPSELMKILEKQRSEISKEKETKLEFQNFQKYFNECNCFMKSWFITKLNTCNESDSDEIIFNLNSLGFKLKKGNYIPIVISMNNPDAKPDEELDDYKIFNGIVKLIENKQICCASFFENNEFTFILSTEDTDENNTTRKAFELCDYIKEYLDYSYKHFYSIGIGITADTLNKIPYTIKTAQDACKYRFYLGENQIIYINDMEPINNKGDYRIKISDDFVTSIKTLDENKMTGVINSIFKDMIDNRYDIDTMKRVSLELVIYTSRAIHELGQNPEILFKKSDVWSPINKCETIEELKELLININSVVISQISVNQNTKNSKIIQKVKDIINKNFDEKLSLEWVAEQVYLSPCYLSIIFSRDTNTTFKEYIITTRINKAKEFLKDEKLKMYEVAQKVGYSDARYFSELFRRYTGQTPAQYRLSLNN